MKLTKDYVKRWIQKEYTDAKVIKECNHKASIKAFIDGCQGLIDFIGSCQPEWKDEIFSWWYEKMLPDFIKLSR